MLDLYADLRFHGTVKPVWNDPLDVKKKWSTDRWLLQTGWVCMVFNGRYDFSQIERWFFQRGWSFQKGLFQTGFTVLQKHEIRAPPWNIQYHRHVHLIEHGVLFGRKHCTCNYSKVMLGLIKQSLAAWCAWYQKFSALFLIICIGGSCVKICKSHGRFLGCAGVLKIESGVNRMR